MAVNRCRSLWRSGGRARAWLVDAYDSEPRVGRCRPPTPLRPDELVVEVAAASVNPIDVAMRDGYGATALNAIRDLDDGDGDVEFPLALGRDFCGTVVSRGAAVDLPLGARVWGVVPVHRQGCHADYVKLSHGTVGKKPANLSATEAAGVLYAGLTAWSGLVYSARLRLHEASGTKALVLGASGGVGSSAVQMLLAGGAQVTATCASDAVSLVESLGVRNILDYTSNSFEDDLSNLGRFDLILDCAGLGSNYILNKPIKFRNYVTFTTPLLKNIDKHGLFGGTLMSVTNLLCPNIQALKNGSIITWAYFIPANKGIDYIYHLIVSGKMRPIVQEVYPFNDLPLAYEKVKNGHLRGKIVINVSEEM